MATFVTIEKNKESPVLSLKNVGKFWILKTDHTSKRLVFLDNAKDVTIEENILIADGKLFEINKNEKGEYIFLKIEDITYEYFSKEKLSSGQCNTDTYTNDMDKSVLNQSHQAHSKRSHTNPIDKDFNEELNEYQGAVKDVKLESDSMTLDEKMRHFNEKADFSDVNEICLSDLNIGSEDADYYDIVKGHEEYDPYSLGSTDADSSINVAGITPTSSHGNGYRVHVEPSKLTEINPVLQGEMILSVQDKILVLSDIVSGNLKYRFSFGWIRRFGKQKQYFFFDVGRKCPIGEGRVFCRTKDSHEIWQKSSPGGSGLWSFYCITSSNTSCDNNSAISDTFGNGLAEVARGVPIVVKSGHIYYFVKIGRVATVVSCNTAVINDVVI